MILVDSDVLIEHLRGKTRPETGSWEHGNPPGRWRSAL